jgi:hypothetical protein
MEFGANSRNKSTSISENLQIVSLMRDSRKSKRAFCLFTTD